MEVHSVDPLDTMIGGIDTIKIAAPVSYVSLPPSSIVMQKQAGGNEVSGSLACFKYGRIAVDRDKKGKKKRVQRFRGREFRCHVNYPLYVFYVSN